MIKILAAQRLMATWFDDLSKEEKRKYVELHPDSKYAQDYDNKKEQEPMDTGDRERKKELRSQIRDLKQDIAEIEAEGNDSTAEKKLKEKLVNELTGLQ